MLIFNIIGNIVSILVWGVMLFILFTEKLEIEFYQFLCKLASILIIGVCVLDLLQSILKYVR